MALSFLRGRGRPDPRRAAADMPRGSFGAPSAFDAHPLIVREAREYARACQCSQRIEAGRAELHRTLDSVLVIDMRFSWNGIGACEKKKLQT